MSKLTLTDRVIEYMEEHGSITTMEAFQYIGATRLSDIIFRMKKDGFSIKTETVKSKNRYGDPVKYAKYSFVEGSKTKK